MIRRFLDWLFDKPCPFPVDIYQKRNEYVKKLKLEEEPRLWKDKEVYEQASKEMLNSLWKGKES